MDRLEERRLLAVDGEAAECEEGESGADSAIERSSTQRRFSRCLLLGLTLMSAMGVVALLRPRCFDGFNGPEGDLAGRDRGDTDHAEDHTEDPSTRSERSLFSSLCLQLESRFSSLVLQFESLLYSESQRLGWRILRAPHVGALIHQVPWDADVYLIPEGGSLAIECVARTRT